MAKAKTAKTAAPIQIYEDVQVEIIRLDRVQLNPYNPKKPMSIDRKKGLNRSLSEFGFKGAVLAAAHPDEPGDYIVLDGNTRIEELRKRGVEKVPCLVYGDVLTWEDIKKFTITYDRNVKAYDEDKVMAQLRELAEGGEDVGLLADLANIPNLDDLLLSPADALSPLSDAGRFDEQDSLLLSGPKSAIDAIRNAARRVKGKLSLCEKLEKIMAEAEGLDWDDDADLIAFVLLAAAHMSGAADKLVIPCVSADQKRVIAQKAAEFIDAEGLTGDFALSRAIEYMVVDR